MLEEELSLKEEAIIPFDTIIHRLVEIKPIRTSDNVDKIGLNISFIKRKKRATIKNDARKKKLLVGRNRHFALKDKGSH